MRSILAMLTLVAAFAFMTGCATYFRVTDPSTGKTYYTEKIEKKSGGAIEFTDGATGGTVTVQNSEVITISKDTYRENVGPAK